MDPLDHFLDLRNRWTISDLTFILCQAWRCLIIQRFGSLFLSVTSFAKKVKIIVSDVVQLMVASLRSMFKPQHLPPKFKMTRITGLGAGKTVHWLRALAILPEDLTLVLGNHSGWLTMALQLQFLRIWWLLLVSLDTHVEDINPCRHIHIQINNNF